MPAFEKTNIQIDTKTKPLLDAFEAALRTVPIASSSSPNMTVWPAFVEAHLEAYKNNSIITFPAIQGPSFHRSEEFYDRIKWVSSIFIIKHIDDNDRFNDPLQCLVSICDHLLDRLLYVILQGDVNYSNHGEEISHATSTFIANLKQLNIDDALFKDYLQHLEKGHYFDCLEKTPLALHKIHKGMHLIFYQQLNYFKDAHHQLLHRFLAYTQQLQQNPNNLFYINDPSMLTSYSLEPFYEHLGHHDLVEKPTLSSMLLLNPTAHSHYHLTDAQKRFLATLKSHPKINANTYPHIEALYQAIMQAKYLKKFSALIETRFKELLDNEFFLMGVFNFDRLAHLVENFSNTYHQLAIASNTPPLEDFVQEPYKAYEPVRQAVDARGKRLIQELRAIKLEPIPLNQYFYSTESSKQQFVQSYEILISALKGIYNTLAPIVPPEQNCIDLSHLDLGQPVRISHDIIPPGFDDSARDLINQINHCMSMIEGNHPSPLDAHSETKKIKNSILTMVKQQDDQTALKRLLESLLNRSDLFELVAYALRLAAYHNKTRCLQYLTRPKCIGLLDAGKESNKIALDFAISAGHANVVEILLTATDNMDYYAPVRQLLREGKNGYRPIDRLVDYTPLEKRQAMIERTLAVIQNPSIGEHPKLDKTIATQVANINNTLTKALQETRAQLTSSSSSISPP